MNSDAIISKMKSEGLNQVHFSQCEEHYTNCPLCMRPICSANPPALFNCGHIICKSCLSSSCTFCGVCNAQKTINKATFYTLLSYINIKANPSQFKSYRFMVKHINKSSATPVQNATGNTTFEEILNECPNFLDYYSQVKQGTQVNIFGKSKLYSDIKSKTVQNFIVENSIIIPKNSQNAAHLITFQDRNRGGSMNTQKKHTMQSTK